MKTKTRVLILILLFCTSHVWAHTSRQNDFICPIGGESFSQMMDMSGTSFGRYLDLKPFGPIAAPWSLPVCPGNQFVMYKDKFTDEEIQTLAKYIESEEYKKITKESTYYRAAQLQRQLNEPVEKIANTLLQATWQRSSYQQEALDEYKKYIQKLETSKDKKELENDETWITAQLVSLELERRTGQFEDAMQRLIRLLKFERFNDESLVFKKILDLQKKLISEKDRNTHEVP